MLRYTRDLLEARAGRAARPRHTASSASAGALLQNGQPLYYWEGRTVMAEQEWKRLARLEDLEPGKLLSLSIGRMEFLVVRRGESIFVCTNRCPHQGGKLSDGILSGSAVICPRHAARFSIETGRMISPPALDELACFSVKIDDGEIFVGRPVAPRRSESRPRRSAKAERSFVIVGGGAAGNACAEALRKEGFDGRVVVLTAEEDLPCDRPALSKGLLDGSTPPATLSLRSRDFYESRLIEVLTNHRVVGVDPRARTVACADGRELAYDMLLLATGGVPRRAGIPGEDLDGCFALRSRADGLALRRAAESAGRAVIVGAGFIGMEAASSLRARGMEVWVVASDRLPLEHVFGQTVAARLLRLHEDGGVRFALGRRPSAVEGASRARRVLLDDGTAREADLVLFALGIEPALDFLRGGGGTHALGAGREGIPVDRRFSTADPHIFAAGDIASVPYGASGARSRVEHWAVAEKQGLIAARAMLGDPAAVFGDQPFFWTDQHGLSLKAVGFPSGRDRVAFRGDPRKASFLAGYSRDGSIVGAASLGFDRELLELQELLQKGKIVPDLLSIDDYFSNIKPEHF